MEKKISINDLLAIKKILDDKDDNMLEKTSILLGNSISSIKKRTKIITDAINGTISLQSDTFVKVIEELIVLQNHKTSKNSINTLTDIKTQENFSDFITFSEDDKKYYVIGDLHADLNSFLEILKSIKFQEDFDNINLVFLGDYIDRGKDKLEVVNRIILLKYLLPNNIHLLRGNHELYRIDNDGNYLSPMKNADMSYLFDFLTLLATDEKYKEYGMTKEYIKLYADFFDSMPTVALFNFKDIKICAMHGGLPRADLYSNDYYDSQSYTNFNTLLDSTTKDNVGISQKINMLWSDPYDGYDEGFTNTSEVRFSFSKNQFIAFCKKYDIDMILRAHEAQHNGYKPYFDNRLISVFSSGGKKLDGTLINEHSYYDTVSPNFLEITDKSIKSININFDENKPAELEQEFQYKEILEDRAKHEQVHEVYIPNKLDNIFEHIKNSKDSIQIIDINNKKNKKIFLEPEIILNHSSLQQFAGIHKDLKFSINKKKKIITNLCEFPLNIGIGGTMIKKDKSIEVNDKFIISVDNAFVLIVTI